MLKAFSNYLKQKYLNIIRKVFILYCKDEQIKKLISKQSLYQNIILFLNARQDNNRQFENT